jgi:hypothetical protein
MLIFMKNRLYFYDRSALQLGNTGIFINQTELGWFLNTVDSKQTVFIDCVKEHGLSSLKKMESEKPLDKIDLLKSMGRSGEAVLILKEPTIHGKMQVLDIRDHGLRGPVWEMLLSGDSVDGTGYHDRMIRGFMTAFTLEHGHTVDSLSDDAVVEIMIKLGEAFTRSVSGAGRLLGYLEIVDGELKRTDLEYNVDVVPITIIPPAFVIELEYAFTDWLEQPNVVITDRTAVAKCLTDPDFCAKVFKQSEFAAFLQSINAGHLK